MIDMCINCVDKEECPKKSVNILDCKLANRLVYKSEYDTQKNKYTIVFDDNEETEIQISVENGQLTFKQVV